MNLASIYEEATSIPEDKTAEQKAAETEQEATRVQLREQHERWLQQTHTQKLVKFLEAEISKLQVAAIGSAMTFNPDDYEKVAGNLIQVETLKKVMTHVKETI